MYRAYCYNDFEINYLDILESEIVLEDSEFEEEEEFIPEIYCPGAEA